MAPRQVWLFQLGCWVALATAAVHLAAYITATPHVQEQGVEAVGALAPRHVFLVPGLRQPTFFSVFDGFSLSLALFVATVGAAGMGVLKHGGGTPVLMRSVARAFALGTALLLVASIVQFFSVQTFLIAVMVMCFALAAVTPE